MNPDKRESFGYFDILYIRTFRNITILKRGIEVAKNDNKSKRKDKKDEETTFTLILTLFLVIFTYITKRTFIKLYNLFCTVKQKCLWNLNKYEKIHYKRTE